MSIFKDLTGQKWRWNSRQNPRKLSIAECSNKTEGNGGELWGHERVLQKDGVGLMGVKGHHEADTLKPQVWAAERDSSKKSEAGFWLRQRCVWCVIQVFPNCTLRLDFQNRQHAHGLHDPQCIERVHWTELSCTSFSPATQLLALENYLICFSGCLSDTPMVYTVYVYAVSPATFFINTDGRTQNTLLILSSCATT